MRMTFAVQQIRFLVTPAPAGVQGDRTSPALGSRFRGNDAMTS